MARPSWLKFLRSGAAVVEDFRAALLGVEPASRAADSDRLTQDLARLLADSGPAARHQPILAAAAVAQAGLAAATPQEGAGVLVGDATDSGALASGEDGRSASLYLNGTQQSLTGMSAVSPFAVRDASTNYFVIASADFTAGLVVDTRTKTLLQGGPGDYPELGAGPSDTLVLDGDYSSGIGLAAPAFVDQILASRGNDYNLVADDAMVGAGQTLTINAMPLRGDNNIIFDGSAESDGRYLFYGSDAGDVFMGGAGDDRIWGLGGADILSGGGGRDVFAYHDASQSTGADFDILADFDGAVDRIDLTGTVSGFDSAVAGGSLSLASFDDDLGTALAGLGAGRAAWFAPDSGDLAGQIFLVVDANGIAGYQEGEDYVFAVAGSSLADLSAHTGFFI